MLSPRKNGRYAFLRSLGLHARIRVSSVTTIAPYPASSARCTKLFVNASSLGQ